MTVKQNSRGNYSPNIEVSGDIDGDLNIAITGKSNSCSEFTAISRVIEELSTLSSEENIVDDEFIKDPVLKLAKYTELTPYFEDDYVKLGALYVSTYKQAWQASGVTEIQKFGIETYLSYWSRTMLEKYNNDAVQAFHELVKETTDFVGDNTSFFDANAIRFFMYQEFANCHVFSFKAINE